MNIESKSGVNISLTGDEIAEAITLYLITHNIHVHGPRTIRVNGELCKVGHVYVDPSGYVVANGKDYGNIT